MASPPSPAAKALGDAARLIRNELGFGQDAFARHANLHRTYVSQIERGVTNVRLDNLLRLAAAFDMTGAELLRRAGL